MADLPVQQDLGNDADDFPAGRQRRIREGAHQPRLAAAVDQGELSLGDQATGLPGQVQIVGSIAEAGTAKHTDGAHGAILTEVPLR